VETLLSTFVDLAHAVVLASVATVDERGRPRSRVMHPMWATDGDHLEGWVLTRPTPLKRAALSASAHVSVLYHAANHDVLVAECDATWLRLGDRAAIWERFASAGPPVGYEPGTIWPGPDADDLAVLHLEPWRVSVARATEVASGGRPHVWRRPTSTSAAPHTGPVTEPVTRPASAVG
jgi:hypothetical protein